MGVIADWAVSWAYDELYDPVGELTKKMDEQLGQLEQMILVGDAEQPGLEKRLQDYASRRSQAPTPRSGGRSFLLRSRRRCRVLTHKRGEAT